MGFDEQQDGIHQPHDTGYRFLMSSKKLFVELLHSFVDKGWVSAVEESNVEQVPRSFILPDFKKQEADIVYQVKVNGQDVLFYLLLELQSSVDFLMPYRLLLYQVAIWRYWMENQDKKLAEQKGFMLPPIVPLVLYNGNGSWTASRRFRDKIARNELFGDQLIDFEYLLIDVVRYQEEDLLALSNTIGSVFLLDQVQDKNELQNRLVKLMGTIRELPEDNQQKFFTWMDHVLANQLPDRKNLVEGFIDDMKKGEKVMSLEDTLNAIKREGREEGLLEGKLLGEQKGKLEGKLEGNLEGKEDVARQMLADQMDTALIIKLTGLSPERIEQLQRERLH